MERERQTLNVLCGGEDLLRPVALEFAFCGGAEDLEVVAEGWDAFDSEEVGDGFGAVGLDAEVYETGEGGVDEVAWSEAFEWRNCLMNALYLVVEEVCLGCDRRGCGWWRGGGCIDARAC